MSLYSWSYWFCEELLVPLVTPLLYFQEHIMPPFSNPAGDLARWMESGAGLNVLAWTVAVNVVLMFGLMNLLVVIYLERKIAARIMDRRGPMLSWHTFKEIGSDLAGSTPEYGWKTTTYSGIGFWQNLADGIKLFTKEMIIPAKADRLLYTIGPVIFISSSLLLLALVPFSPGFAASSAPLGLLVVMAAFSIAPIGVLTTGWACNNKYTLIGGMRSAAQLMAYEIPLLLSMAGVFLVAGSFHPLDIVAYQQTGSWLFGLPMWNIVPQFIGFIVFIICILAEIERVPFDLPEAEAELVEGWTTELSGLRFGLFLAAEYIRGFVGAMVATVLFLGGWAGPYLPGEIWFLIKVYTILVFFIILRWTVPRIRTDQILLLGWKRLLPLSLLNLAIVILMVEIYPLVEGVLQLPEVF